jgi:hypothetical protein
VGVYSSLTGYSGPGNGHHFARLKVESSLSFLSHFFNKIAHQSQFLSSLFHLPSVFVTVTNTVNGNEKKNSSTELEQRSESAKVKTCPRIAAERAFVP